jgi:aerobic-type carbon monoxide dehydrogenase small subunit (CoxS/CutS family)
MARREIELRVNGRPLRGSAEPRTTLADFLRDELGLTGTHLGCEHGVCGACTILLDGRSVRSCLLFAVQAQGSELRTVEGLADPDGPLHPIQEAFSEHHGLQCGFCTPGFLMSVCELLADDPDPDEQEIREYLSGNLCRCTGYQNIVVAVQAAAAKLRGGPGGLKASPPVNGGDGQGD